MADLLEIKRIADAAARGTMMATPIDDVTVTTATGSDGDELLQVRIVIPDEQADAIDFEQFFEATLQIKRAVRSAGDDRHALVGYITPTQLAELGDPEP